MNDVRDRQVQALLELDALDSCCYYQGRPDAECESLARDSQARLKASLDAMTDDEVNHEYEAMKGRLPPWQHEKGDLADAGEAHALTASA